MSFGQKENLGFKLPKPIKDVKFPPEEIKFPRVRLPAIKLADADAEASSRTADYAKKVMDPRTRILSS